jgi:hypothetical protein
MAVTITRTTADTYFSTRLDKDVWNNFDAGLRDRAIVSAKDVISRSLGSDVTDETTSDSSEYYPDRAVYHQALYMLVSSDHTANGEFTGPKWPGSTKGGDAKDIESGKITDEALRWLNWRSGPTIKLARA